MARVIFQNANLLAGLAFDQIGKESTVDPAEVQKFYDAHKAETERVKARHILIRMQGAPPTEKLSAESEEAIPILSDVIETHRLEVDNGALADEFAEWVRQERPGFDPREYGFQEFSELLNYAQDKSLLRIVTDENRGPVVYLGAEFHPSAPPPEPAVATEIEEEEYELQPLVPGQPTATGEIPLAEPPPKPMRRPHARKPAGVGGKERRQRPRGRGRM